jgi:hypothetical protein
MKIVSKRRNKFGILILAFNKSLSVAALTTDIERTTNLPEKSLSGCRKLHFSRQTRDSIENMTQRCS